VFGEEAHIVAQGRKGPRAGSVADVDSYDNLILLCRKHHKQVDDQVGYYTVDRMKELKRAHEEWVATLGEPTGPGPIRLVPDPTRPLRKTLTIITTGSALWRFVEGSHGFYANSPDGLSDEQADLIDGFFEGLRDWGDIAGEIDSFRAKRDACRYFDGYIKDLAEAGFIVGARERSLLLTGGIDAQPSPWRAYDIEVHLMDDAQIVDADGKAVRFDRQPGEAG
jgi:hypothetical protein